MLVLTSVRSNPRVTKQAASLARAGYRVIVVSAGQAGEAERLERDPRGFVILRASPRWLRAEVSDGKRPSLIRGLFSRLVSAVRMLPLVRRTRPGLILGHNLYALPLAWLASLMTRARLAYDAHEVNLDRGGYYQRIRPLIRVIEGCLLPRCDLMITTTGMRARHYRRVYHLPSTPRIFENRPPYVPVSRGDRLRRACGIGPETVIALYQGVLQEGRGLHNMVRAVAGVDSVALVMLGEGPQRQSLMTLAEELDVDDRVHFPGRVPLEELAEWTASADLGLQLLRNTCFNHYSTDSNKLFEYAMAGLPVLASDFPEIRKLVKRHGFGLLVSPEDVAGIRAALVRLVDDGPLRRQLASAARDSAWSLSWDAVEDEYVDVVGGLVRAPGQ